MLNDRTILTLDLGNNIGWAVSKFGKVFESGFYQLKDIDCKVRSLYIFLDLLIDKYGIFDDVYSESINVFGHFRSLKVLFGYDAILDLWCSINSLPLTKKTPTAIKKYISGNGRASKELVIQRVNTIFVELKKEVKNHNEADSLALMAMILGK